ncbi:hypothetical protein OG754_01025 [Streptomyces decoyicus]|uniref:hypothetical protein n=1 Tax=Streptomyces decoyicus TaxID=249567 RepID=UPI002E359001|nr:hypothetical protein [Streptomyces decoyicus]
MPSLHFRFINGTVTAKAKSDQASALLAAHKFTPAADDDSYLPSAGLNERDLVYAVVLVECHAYADGFSVWIDLDVPTPDALRATPRRPSGAVPSGSAREPSPRRSR